jgi:hypothetical protein
MKTFNDYLESAQSEAQKEVDAIVTSVVERAKKGDMFGPEDNNEIGMLLDAEATDVTATSEDFDFVVKLMTAGAVAAEKFRVSSTGNATLTGDLAVNGDDLTTSQTTFNLVNTTATTVNFAGAATNVQIGAATGTTEINNDLNVVGDVDIDGGDLTVSTSTFNLANATATTVNFAGAATTLEIGAATGTTNINNNLVVDLDLEVKGGDLTTNQTTFNLLTTNATTGNLFSVASAVNVSTSAALASTLTFGPVITGNSIVINSTTGGTVNIDSDVTTGIVNLFAGITTGTVNIAAANGSTVNVGGVGSTTNIVTLALTNDLVVQHGGTGTGTFTTKGIVYGNGTDPLQVTAASLPGSNATTSYGILTTDVNNVPVWTDVIDEGEY